MDPQQRIFSLAVGVSVLLHAIVLSIHFNLPGMLLKLVQPPALEVMLVNTKTRNAPEKAQIAAQANVNGGGDVDQDRRATSPVPVTQKTSHGDDLVQAAQRVQELEAQQRQLLAQLKAEAAQAVPPPQAVTQPTPAPKVNGQDLRDRALLAVQNLAAIDRDVDEYNKRPKKLFVGVQAAENSAAMYLLQWSQKVTQIGNLNYPDIARGKFYGDVQMQVTLHPDGSIQDYQMLHTSGYSVLDEAAKSIVLKGAPYAAISPSVLHGNDLLVITRTMSFVRGDQVFSK